MPNKPEQAFLDQLDGKPPPAFILGNGTSHTLGFVRSLGRRDVPVVAVSAEAGPLVRSRYCWIDRVLNSESDLMAFLGDIGPRLPRKGVLIATGDGDMLFLSRNRTRLERFFHFVISEAAVLESLASKKSQYDLAASVGIPVPETHCPEGPEDLDRLAECIGYPCLIKPAYSHLWRGYRRRVDMQRWEKAAHIETPEQLRGIYRQMREGGVELLIQERIEGSDSRLYSLYAYLDRASEPLAIFVMQKQRQWPPMYGTGSYSTSCRQEEIVALGMKFLKSVGYRGLTNIEFKQDPKDGKFKLIEVNIRSGNRIALPIDSGVDIPYIAYRDILGERPAPVREYKVGVAWLDLPSDIAAFVRGRQTTGLTLWQWAHSALTAKSHAHCALDDPLPFLAHLSRTAKKAFTLLRR